MSHLCSAGHISGPAHPHYAVRSSSLGLRWTWTWRLDLACLTVWHPSSVANVSTITSLVSSHLWPSRVSETSIASAISTPCVCHHPQGRLSPLEPLQIASERSRPLSAVYHGNLPRLLFILHTDVQLMSISGRRASTLRATLCCMYAAAPRPSHQKHQFRVRQRGSPAPTLARLAADSAEKFRLRNGIMLVSWIVIRQCLRGGPSNTKALT